MRKKSMQQNKILSKYWKLKHLKQFAKDTKPTILFWRNYFARVLLELLISRSLYSA